MSKFLRFQLINRRDRLGLTRQGWLFGLALVMVVVWGLVSQVHGFFALSQPIANADLLVVEGWVSDGNAQDAIQEFKSHPYKAIVTTGTQLPRGYYLSEYKSFAELSRASLIKMGIPTDRVIAIPAAGVPRDRSYASAMALSQWLRSRRDRNPGDSGVYRSANLFTEGVHARRSWTLFKRALVGSQLELGIISVPSTDYDTDRWWTQSEGFKRVLFEMIGWVYVQVFNRAE